MSENQAETHAAAVEFDDPDADLDLAAEAEERAKVITGLLHGLLWSGALVAIVWVLHEIFGSHLR